MSEPAAGGGPAGDGDASRGRVGAAALLLAASVLLSRVMGYLRDVVLAGMFGATSATDAYWSAFQLPDFLNYLLAGGALSVAFIPFYSRALRERGRPAAERIFATVLGTTGVVAAVGTAALWWWADPIIARFFAYDPPTHALTVRLTRIVLPAQIFFVTGGIVRAVLMAHGRFGAHAAAPLLYNGAIIAGGLLFGRMLGVEAFAWGVLVGAVLGPFLVPLYQARTNLRIRMRVAPHDRDFRAYLWIAAPLMIGLSLLTVNEWYNKIFGSRIGEGVVSWLGYSGRLFQAPVAVVGQALAAAALPTFARLWSEGRREALDHLVLRTLQVGLALAVLAAAGFLALAEPIVDVAYRRGAFSDQDAAAVTHLLRIFSLAVPPFIVQQVASRSFFARGDTWRPMLLSTVVALGMLPLYAVLGERYGASGLAAAGALGLTLNAGATLLLARRLHGAPDLGALASTGARVALAATPAAVAGALVPHVLGGTGLLGALRDLLLGGAAFGAVGLPLAWGIGDPPMREALLRLGRRLRRVRPPPEA